MINITSEIKTLKSVIVHQPGIEHNLISADNIKPWEYNNGDLQKNQKYLLFDDMIYVNKAQKEHEQLKRILNQFTNNHCFEFIDLLENVIENLEVRESIINDCFEIDSSFDKKHIPFLLDISSKKLANIFLSGYCFDEKKQIFQLPIPNLIFTRDIAAVIGKMVLITWGFNKVRNRENILTKHIFKNHMEFQNIKIFDFHKNYPDLNIEGGDILILDSNTVLIGISERTSRQAIDAISPEIFNQGFTQIIAIDIPKSRSSMHLDTVLTKIDHNDIIIYPPLFESNNNSDIKYFIIDKNKSIYDISPKPYQISDIISGKTNFIKCGSDKIINQKREQWTDGANAFAIAPGVAVGYEHNTYTINELKSNGYTVYSSSEIDSSFKLKPKTFISFPGYELSRGRGGARCLTLPLYRK